MFWNIIDVHQNLQIIWLPKRYFYLSHSSTYITYFYDFRYFNHCVLMYSVSSVISRVLWIWTGLGLAPWTCITKRVAAPLRKRCRGYNIQEAPSGLCKCRTGADINLRVNILNFAPWVSPLSHSSPGLYLKTLCWVGFPSWGIIL